MTTVASDSLCDSHRSRSGRFSLVAGLLTCAVLFAVAGCEGFGSADKSAPSIIEPQPADTTPSYADVAKSYNANAGRIDQLWSRAIVTSRWTDDAGSRKTEQGEGHFII